MALIITICLILIIIVVYTHQDRACVRGHPVNVLEYFTVSDLDTDHGDSVACANYHDKEGWHVFEVETYPPYQNDLRSLAAGYLEGYIYYKYINYHFANIEASIFNGNVSLISHQAMQFVLTQRNYTKNIAKKNSSNYEETLFYILKQHEGLYLGYTTAYFRKPLHNFPLISEENFYLITMQGDLVDILQAYPGALQFMKHARDCTAYVRLNKAEGNLIVGHNTHNMYTLMNRIYKYYHLNLRLSSGKLLNDYKFSSRPGDMNSKDDYYILTNKMVVLETSLEIIDKSIYSKLQPDTIPKWIRVSIANKLATKNSDWVETFFYKNSGTHNNQWLIVDYNQFGLYFPRSGEEDLIVVKDLSRREEKDIVYLVEQTPCTEQIYFKDFTHELFANGYVASYNAPYFPDVIRDLGYSRPPHDQKVYDKAKRYFLFQKLNPGVTDIESAKKIMTYHDQENLCDTIGARCDLIEDFPFGAVDAKITDRSLIDDNLKSAILYGPPYIENVSIPFNFTKFPKYAHPGIPEVFDYKWIEA